jgi:hypothetical protein
LQENDTTDHHLLQCIAALELNIENKIKWREKWDSDTLVCTLCYALWKNRYVWVFADGCKQRSPLSLAALLTKE